MKSLSVARLKPEVPVAARMAGWMDVDPRIKAAFAQHGIQKLHPPQESAVGPVLSGRNVVVAIPTASGKSLIAYLALLHRFLTLPTGAKGLYIVPLRALASEKYEELQGFKSLGLRVGIATGDLDEQDDHLGRFDVVVATSEKVDSLLRHRANWLHDVRTVIADEIHLLHDAGRGPTLEVILARFRSLNPNAQILGLSATIRNARQLADWLQGDLVESEWRPTPLKKGVAYGRSIDFLENDLRPIIADSGDPVADLVLDILAEGGQALVFVSTRKSAEAVASRLGKIVRPRLSAEEQAKLDTLAKELVDEGEPTLSGRRLGESAKGGAAFHNAGLGNRQRRRIEQAFRDGTLKVLAATPTLAAGVNTPARRVIIRDVYRYDANMGNQAIPVLEAQQMMGRAGRPRYDSYGEAVLLAKTMDDRESLIESYLKAKPEPITSKLGAEPALRVHVLASIASGFTTSRPAVEKFLDSTFYAHQGEAWLIKAQLQQVLRFLVDNDFVNVHCERLEATAFGKRTSDLYVDPLSALILRQAIERASKRKDVPTFAFLQALSATPDIDALFLRTKDDWVIEKLAQEEEGLLYEVHEARSQDEFLSQVKTAALLEDWIEETPIERIEEKYGVGPGDIRNKVDVGEWLAHAARELARLFHFETATALNHLPLRLREGVKQDILPLLELSGIGRVRARTLYRHGFKSIGLLRKARAEELARLPGFGPILVQSLKKQVGDAQPKEVGLGSFAEP